jgi:drug/metabolite transporter (DMT)-like permease
MPNAPSRGGPLAWMLLVITALTWGSMFILVKKGLVFLSAAQLFGLRQLAMFVLVLPLLPGLIRQWRTPGLISPETKNAMLWIPFLGTLLPVFLITFAQTSVGSGSTGLVHAVGPLVALLVGVLFFGERVGGTKLLGLVLGFVGVAALVFGAKSARIEGEAWAFGLLLFSMFCYGFTSHFMKQRLHGLSLMAYPTATFTLLALPGLFMFSASGGWQALQALQGTAAIESVLLIVSAQACVALLAHVCYTRVIVLRGALFAVSVNYLVPIVALFWAFLDGETLSSLHFVCFALVGVGLYLANRVKTKL